MEQLNRLLAACEQINSNPANDTHRIELLPFRMREGETIARVRVGDRIIFASNAKTADGALWNILQDMRAMFPTLPAFRLPIAEPPKPADDTTIAFLAIGCATALRHATEGQISALNDRQNGGQDTTVANVIEYAALLDGLFDAHGYDDGVFYYDVAEPFGSWITTRMLEGKDTTNEEAQAHALRLMNVNTESKA
jgi:hypothetical protein